MSKVTVLNTSKRKFMVEGGIIEAGKAVSVDKEVGEKLVATYNTELQLVDTPKPAKEEKASKPADK